MTVSFNEVFASSRPANISGGSRWPYRYHPIELRRLGRRCRLRSSLLGPRQRPSGSSMLVVLVMFLVRGLFPPILKLRWVGLLVVDLLRKDQALMPSEDVTEMAV